MQIFRYKVDIFPITIIVWFFLLDIFVYFFVLNIGFLIVYTLISILLKGFICPWNHHHQHTPTFFSPVLNRILEVVYWFQTGVIGYAWVLHHNLGHHLHYQDQTQDESAWKSPKWERYTPLMYTLNVAITAYPRAWKVGKKYPQIQRYFLYMGILQILIFSILIAYRPLAGILIFFVPMITWLFITVYTTYHQHSWLESNDHYQSSYNIRDRWYNFLTGNIGYHTAHHLRANLHWSKIRDFHTEIEDKIDEKYYKKNNFFYYTEYKGS